MAQYPNAGLVQGSDGYFYGTTDEAAARTTAGTVFKISTNGALTTLYSFTGGNDGAYPDAGWCRAATAISMARLTAAARNRPLYGTVFKISTNGALTSLYSFTGGNDGGYPYAGLVQGSDGYFYGTTVRRRHELAAMAPCSKSAPMGR